jgi:hypothetical protein
VIRTAAPASASLPLLLLLFVLLLLLAASPARSAGKLHTRYGFAIEAEAWWERDGILYYRQGGATHVIPRGDVLRIEGVPDNPPPAQGPVQIPAQRPAAALTPAGPRFCLAGAAPVVTRGDLEFIARMRQALARLADAAVRETIADRLGTCARFMHQALSGEGVDAGDLRAYCCP